MKRITSQSVQSLVQSIPLHRHIQKYCDTQKSGQHHLTKCLFHNDTHPSLTIYENSFHCFACKKSGNIIDFEMKRTGKSFFQTVEDLALEYQVTLQYHSSQQDEKWVAEQREAVSWLERLSQSVSENKEEQYYQVPQDEKKLEKMLFDRKKYKGFLSYGNFPEVTKNLRLRFYQDERDRVYGFSLCTKQSPHSYKQVWLGFFPVFFPQLAVGIKKARGEAAKKKSLIVIFDEEIYNKCNQNQYHNAICILDPKIHKKFVLWTSKFCEQIIFCTDEKDSGFLWQTWQEIAGLSFMKFSVAFSIAEIQNPRKFHKFIFDKVFQKCQTYSDKLYSYEKYLMPILRSMKSQTYSKILQDEISQKYLLNQSKPDFTLEDPLQDQKKTESHDILLEKVAAFYHEHLFSRYGETGREYCQKRGFTKEGLVKWKIGYSSNFSTLSHCELFSNDDKKELAQFGILKQGPRDLYDFLHHRLIFPLKNEDGKVVAFAGRIVGKVDRGPKYLNTQETSLFQKSHFLYHFYEAKKEIRKQGFAIVVEGYMDCIALTQRGISNVVAVLGTALTAHHVNLLKKETNHIMLCFDSDSAGKSAMKRTFFHLISSHDVEFSVFLLPQGLDPDDYISRVGPQKFQEEMQSRKGLLGDYVLNEIFQNSQDGEDCYHICQQELQPHLDKMCPEIIQFIDKRINAKFGFSFADFAAEQRSTGKLRVFKKNSGSLVHEVSSQPTQEIGCGWSVKSLVEVKLLFSLCFASLDDLPSDVQGLLSSAEHVDEDALFIGHVLKFSFSDQTLKLFLEMISAIRERYSTHDWDEGALRGMSQDVQRLVGFVCYGTSVTGESPVSVFEQSGENENFSAPHFVLSNVWSRKNASFLKVYVDQIRLAQERGLMRSCLQDYFICFKCQYLDYRMKILSKSSNQLEVAGELAELVRRRNALGELSAVT